jgi:hypothetical protein
VGGVDEFLPKQVVEQVDTQIDREFSMHMHLQAWRYFEVRPPSDAADKHKTKTQYCYWNTLVKNTCTPPIGSASSFGSCLMTRSMTRWRR